MTKYEFTVVLQGSPELTDELADKLFAAGCDDGTPGMGSGVTVIDFHREAESLEAALWTAIAQVNSVGESVARVEIDAASLATTT
jgi:hypothetical protein